MNGEQVLTLRRLPHHIPCKGDKDDRRAGNAAKFHQHGRRQCIDSTIPELPPDPWTGFQEISGTASWIHCEIGPAAKPVKNAAQSLIICRRFSTMSLRA